MITTQLELAFSRTYDIRLGVTLADSPAVGDVLHFPDGRMFADSDGLILGVFPEDGPAWLATCVAGGVNDFSAVFGAPSCDEFFAVVSGLGYLIDATARECRTIEPVGLIGGLSLPDFGLIVFWDSTRINAYDSTGLRWTSDRLSYDGVWISCVNGGELAGLGFDSRDETRVPFVVDLRTGAHKGGADPHA